MANQVENKKSVSLDSAGPFLRDIVFGVHDALLTNIGIITGFVAALQDSRLIVTAALIDVIISAFAMAFGTYLSRTSESDYLEKHLEDKEHAQLASVVGSPVMAAVVMWVTYVISGLIPLIPFALNLDTQTSMWWAIVLALIVFFVVGVFKGHITHTNAWRSGLQFISFGGTAAVIGYIVGTYGQRLLG